MSNFIGIAAITFAVLGTVYWLLVLYAGVRTVRALRVVADTPRVPQAYPRISIVIAARDEEATIGASINSFEHLNWPNLEIVLVNDRSTDATGALISAAAAIDSRIRPIHIDVLPSGWLGKVHALEQGIAGATGEWILLTDADVELAESALQRAVATTEQFELDHLALLPEVEARSIRVAGAVAVFSRWLVIAGRLWRAAEPGTPGAFGVGAFNFVRRSALIEAGGLSWLRMDVADDAALGALIAQSGRRSMLASGVGVARVHWQTSLRSMAKGYEKYGSTGGVGTHPQAVGLVTLALLGELGPVAAIVLGAAGTGTLATTAALIGIWIEITAVVGTGLLASRSGAPTRGLLTVPFAALFIWVMQLRSSFLEYRRGGLVWRETFYPTPELREGKRFKLG